MICSAFASAWANGNSESACPALIKVGAVMRSVTLAGDDCRMRTLDAGDMRSMSFVLGEGGPLVIIGYENLKERLQALHDTLRDPRLVLDSISYIDVRFKDVAISPK